MQGVGRESEGCVQGGAGRVSEGCVQGVERESEGCVQGVGREGEGGVQGVGRESEGGVQGVGRVGRAWVRRCTPSQADRRLVAAQPPAHRPAPAHPVTCPRRPRALQALAAAAHRSLPPAA